MDKKEEVLMVLQSAQQDLFIGFELVNVIRVLRSKPDKLYPIPRSSDEVLGLLTENQVTFPIFDLAKIIPSGETSLAELSNGDAYLSIIITTLKGYQIGLATAVEPDFFKVEKHEELKNGSIYTTEYQKIDSEEKVKLINIDSLFPNFELVGSVTTQKDNEQDDLDLSQYLISE